ncbi:hypothetical protein DP113_31335 [Brasilonema octagenarum UFV-E1]|uniref:Demethylmenaquinone methyltransferase n=2 Tax=Brasilonema TaxID=383614 RepID=A0A856MM64_9CYAN|nr:MULTISPECIES: class I SAM-dependent methyltransferase [Brasilonema]NMF64146.1 hypothetical protein [Brasilonema octagenarum UFV-OR1]QDL11768.1 hypothetical protein DP114_31195 [Brasilonema sennae CENA114]QDL18149.1 hypothetical protein DP113_31335 [Brasilonema octagenarum UFV-E1]
MSQNTNYSSVTPTQATKLEGDDKRNYIRNLFDDIATRYDFLRTLVFLGHTSLWYRQALRDLQLQPGEKILDVGCGTGESTRCLNRFYPGIQIEGMDLSPGMLSVARSMDADSNYFEGDVCSIPRPDCTYDVVVTAFTFRNFPNREVSLAQMLRVLRPGGRLLILDHFYPEKPVLWRNIYTIWMSKIVPQIVRPFIADTTPYRYLAQSIINQLKMPDFIQLIETSGAKVTKTNTYTGGAAGRLIAVRHPFA